MPIRFRCAYCNQLMGISKRKAGSVVRCPKCAGEIIVPGPEAMEPAEDAAEAPQPPNSVKPFEADDFDRYLDEPANGSASPAATETAAAPAPAALAPAIAPVVAPPQRSGLFLSVVGLIVSLAVIVLLLIAMFVAGYYIGQRTAPPPEPKDALIRVSPLAA